MKYAYGIFFTDKTTKRGMMAFSTRKREAETFARQNAGTIGRMSGAVWRDGVRAGGWDAPTFKVSAEIVADYRGGGR